MILAGAKEISKKILLHHFERLSRYSWRQIPLKKLNFSKTKNKIYAVKTCFQILIIYSNKSSLIDLFYY